MNKDLSVSGILKESWQGFTENISYVYYLFIPSLAFSLLAIMVDWQSSAILSLIGVIIAMFSTISLLFFFRSGKKDTYATWKNYFALLPKYIGVSILQCLMIFAGLIFFIIPGIYLALRYAFVGYRTLEHPTESIQDLFAAEAKATEGNRLTILAILVLLILTAIILSGFGSAFLSSLVGREEGSLITSFLVEVLVTPFFTIVSILMYLKMTSKKGLERAKESTSEPVIESTPTPEPVV